MNNYYEKPFYQSKKWWTMLLGIGIVIAASKGLIPWEAIYTLAPIVGYEIAQGMADFGKNRTTPPVGKTPVAAVAASEKEKPSPDITQPVIRPEPSEALLGKGEAQQSDALRIVGDIVTAQAVLPLMTPADWEREYIAYFVERVKYYKVQLAEYPDTRFGFDELLKTAEHTLKDAKIRVASVKRWWETDGQQGSPPWTLSNIGYYIVGQKPPWEKSYD